MTAPFEEIFGFIRSWKVYDTHEYFSHRENGRTRTTETYWQAARHTGHGRTLDTVAGGQHCRGASSDYWRDEVQGAVAAAEATARMLFVDNQRRLLRRAV